MNWNLRNSVMFISWDRPLTKNQMLNAKGCTLLFFIETSTKDFGSHLMFSIRFLVTSISNEMQTLITYPLFLMTAIVGNRTHIRLLDTYTHINTTKVIIEKSRGGRFFMEQELRFGLDLGEMADFPALIASKSFDL